MANEQVTSPLAGYLVNKPPKVTQTGDKVPSEVFCIPILHSDLEDNAQTFDRFRQDPDSFKRQCALECMLYYICIGMQQYDTKNGEKEFEPLQCFIEHVYLG